MRQWNVGTMTPANRPTTSALEVDDMDDGGAGEQLGFDALLERARSCGLVETTG